MNYFSFFFFFNLLFPSTITVKYRAFYKDDVIANAGRLRMLVPISFIIEAIHSDIIQKKIIQRINK